MKKAFFGFLCLTALIATAPASFSAEEGMPGACALKDRSSAVAVVVCEPDAEDSVWREAGLAACGTDPECNVWIWASEEAAPDSAPDTDTGLGEQYTATAVAVWVNDSQSLIALNRAR